MGDRISVNLTLRAGDPGDGIPSAHIVGLAPAVDCPLAIGRDWFYDDAQRTWATRRGGWHVYHRRLGWHLGPDSWTEDDAWRLLLACDPSFMAWHFVRGDCGPEEPALVACYAKFTWALEETGVVHYGRKTVADYRHVRE